VKRALLIEFNSSTGDRAGGISPRDPKLRCYGWQNLESEPNKEIRLVEDDRDLSRYEGIPGGTILSGETEINQAIDTIVPERYSVQDKDLFLEHLRQKDIALDDYSGQSQQDILCALYERGVVGIGKGTPRRV